MSAPLKHVAILGAGVCGLAAALELLRSGAAERVTILEADERPGGMARTVYDPSGLKSDLGPHRIHTEFPEIDKLLRELADKELYWVDRRSAMHVEGQWVDYPFSVGGVLRLFGPLEFLRMGLSAVWAKLTGLFGGRPVNFEEHMRRHFGARVYGRVLAPYSEKVWKTPPAEISATAAEVRVSAGSLTKMARRILSGGREKAGEETALRRFRYLKGGVESLVRRLAERVTAVGGEIRCDCRVERLICKGDGAWQVHHTQGEIGANAVISTIPVTHLPGLLRGDGFPTPPKESVEALVYLEIVLVFLVIERAQVSENHWLYFPDADICFNRGYEPSRFSDDPEKPPNQTLLCLEITARPNSALLKSTDEDLRVLVRRDLARTGLVKEEEVGKSFVVRLPFGYPLYDRHADENLARVLDCLRRWPGLVTTGRQGIFSHNNMDHSMHMGIEAARALAAGAEGQARWYDGVEGLRHFRIVD